MLLLIVAEMGVGVWKLAIIVIKNQVTLVFRRVLQIILLLLQRNQFSFLTPRALLAQIVGSRQDVHLLIMFAHLK